MKQQKLIARMIIEILGSPKEHVEDAIKQVIQKLEAEKDIKLVRQKTYEAEQQEETKLWSTFSEIEFQSDSIKKLMGLCFDYMPSSVEILEPAGMEVDMSDMVSMLNDLLARIHKYDMVLKNLHAQTIVMKHDLDIIRDAARTQIKAEKPKKK